MLEKWNQATAIIMVALLDRQCTGDGLPPAVVIDKAAICSQFAQGASRPALIGNDGGAVGDGRFLSILTGFMAYAGKNVNKDELS